MPNLETSVEDWATEAADGFLNKKIAMNTTIAKIASREGLNREKVARVVEEANKTVFLKMFDKTADKCFQFPVADTEQILKGAAPAGRSMGRIEAAPEEPAVKHASDQIFENAMNGFGGQQGWDAMEKAILAQELIREKALMATEQQKEAEVNFCKIAQEMVAQEDYKFEEICTALGSIRPQKIRKIAMLLKVAAVHMEKKFRLPDLEKIAGAAVDPGEHEIVKTISAGNMPVEVINGSHKIVIALDTLIDQTTEAEKANKNLTSADDTVKYLRKEIKNYLATHTHV